MPSVTIGDNCVVGAGSIVTNPSLPTRWLQGVPRVPSARSRSTGKRWNRRPSIFGPCARRTNATFCSADFRHTKLPAFGHELGHRQELRPSHNLGDRRPAIRRRGARGLDDGRLLGGKGWTIHLLSLDKPEAVPFYPLHANIRLESLDLFRAYGNPVVGAFQLLGARMKLRRAIMATTPDCVISFRWT